MIYFLKSFLTSLVKLDLLTVLLAVARINENNNRFLRYFFCAGFNGILVSIQCLAKFKTSWRSSSKFSPFSLTTFSFFDNVYKISQKDVGRNYLFSVFLFLQDKA